MERKSSETCEVRVRLERLAQHHLLELAELARKEADVVESGDQQRILELDKNIEDALGRKERALGAINQHRADHGC